jgi:hypothetical protein
MHFKRVGKLATEATAFYGALREFSDSQVERINFALIHALHDFMPDDVVTAVFEHGGKGHPLILGVANNRLYAFDVPQPPGENEPVAQVRWRSYRLDPEHCEVHAELSYTRPNPAFGREVNRRTHWRFRIHDLEFDLPTRVHAESDGVEPREELAQSLAKSLGVIPARETDVKSLREVA